MKTYSPFHAHSVYSLLDGAAQLKAYFQRADELGLPSISISDHGNIHHVIDAYEIAKEFNVKYIPGAELYQARQTRLHKDELERAGKATDELDQRGPLHLSVIAQNMHGFKNLVKLSSDSWTDGFYGKPRVDHELLAKYGEGLIILSGCLNGEVSQALLRGDRQEAIRAAGRMQEFVGKENFYIEVMRHGIPEEETVLAGLVSIADSIGAKIIPTIDSHYVHKEDADLHDISLCLGVGALRSDENRFKFYNDQFYLKSYEEMAQLFPEEWLRNTVELNEKIQAPDFELKEFQFPIYEYDGDHYSYLRDLTYKGLNQRYGVITKEIEDRIEYELGVIQRMGFVDYMLIVWDIIEWCHSNDIYASARGSAAGAVASYALGITAVDPIRFKLLFERFLIEGRKSLPDIDIDVDEDRREEVINYIRSKYGINRVANICNFTAIKPRSAIRDATRVLGKEYALGDKLANMIPPPFQGFDKTLDESFEESEELRKLYEVDAEVREVLDAARGLEGLIRQTGVHAAGILVTPGPLTDYVPIMQKPNKDGSTGPIITQWNGKQVESLGLLKIDVLGLKNYTIIDKTIKSIKRRKGIDINMDALPLDDLKTYELLRSGDTTTVFQIGASGISNLTYEIQPRQLEDLMAVIALYRPGPLGSHMDRSYLSRKSSGRVSYMHPSLQEAFEDTYGLMIYQEQILAVADKLGGYSISDRDGLRKLVGKKEKDKIKLARGEFVKRCVDYSHISESMANKIFDEIEFFGSYGFNRCVFGETTYIDQPSTNQYNRLSVKDMYRRLYDRLPYYHSRQVPPFNGPCTSCDEYDNNHKYVQGQCRKCRAWRSKFLYQGVYGLSLNEKDNRIYPNKIKNIYSQGMQPCYRVTCEDCNTLDVTANHRSLTNRGWLMTVELKSGDYLILDGGYEQPSYKDQSRRDRLSYQGSRNINGKPWLLGADNRGYIDGGYIKHSQFKVEAPHLCAICSSVEDIHISHKDGNHQNNECDNLQKLCRSCHFKYDYSNNNRTKRWGKGHITTQSRIISIEYIGEKETYDVEMESPHHNFLANGIVTHNSHASAYAYLGFQTAYLKAHFPADYMAAVISCMDDVERAGEHVSNARHLGMEIIGPSINTSDRDFTVIDDQTIQYGMKTIQGLGEATLDKILNSERGYINIYDWLRRTHIETLNKSLIEHLLFAGALDELMPEQEEQLTKRSDRIQILNAEAKELGSYITEHPLKGIWSFLENDISHTISEIGSLQENTNVVVAGLIVNKDVKYSKRDGRMFIFFQLQDLTGTIDVAAFSKSAEKYKDLAVGDIVLIRGPIAHERKLIGEEEAKKSKITLYECRTPQLPEYSIGESIELQFEKKPSPYIIEKILGIIEKNPGDSYITIRYPTDKFELTYKSAKPTNYKVKEQLEMAVLYETKNS